MEIYELDSLLINRCKKLNILTINDKADFQESKKENDIIILGAPIYNQNVTTWINQMYELNLMDRNYQENYKNIEGKDINLLSVEEILTIFTFYIRGERFSPGMIDKGIRDGLLVSLSERLKQLVN